MRRPSPRTAATSATRPASPPCPTGIDIPLVVRRISTGMPRAAAKTICDRNILAGCARACPTETLCEQACVREAAEGKPVATGRLQRFATDPLMERGGHPYARAAPTGRRVAVVGAGPAGPACAHRLALKKHAVTLFDARAKAGGLNEFGIRAGGDCVAVCIKCGRCYVACEDTSHQSIAIRDGRVFEVIDEECVACNLCHHLPGGGLHHDGVAAGRRGRRPHRQGWWKATRTGRRTRTTRRCGRSSRRCEAGADSLRLGRWGLFLGRSPILAERRGCVFPVRLHDRGPIWRGLQRTGLEGRDDFPFLTGELRHHGSPRVPLGRHSSRDPLTATHHNLLRWADCRHDLDTSRRPEAEPRWSSQRLAAVRLLACARTADHQRSFATRGGSATSAETCVHPSEP